MAETIYNNGSTTYTLTGSSDSVTVSSNNLPINFDNSSGLTVTKTPSTTTFAVGDIITYAVKITNSGANYLNGVRIIDNLGGNYLAYVTGSGSLSTITQTYPVTPVATNPLTFTLQQLAVGASMTLTYKAQVVYNLPSSVSSITNSVQAIGYPASGTVNAYASSTIQKKTSSGLTMTKSANVTTAVPNQTFNYYLTLTNGNSVVANISNVTDNLPSNFTVESVKLQIGTGSSSTLSSSDYTVSSSNVLSVPSSTGPTITVPASGTTVVTITGHLS